MHPRLKNVLNAEDYIVAINKRTKQAGCANQTNIIHHRLLNAAGIFSPCIVLIKITVDFPV